MLSVTGLTMRFGGLKAVDDLSFEARAGEITAVIGPNGAGKTTVFNCITGFYRPSEGGIALTMRRAHGSRWIACPAIASPRAPRSREHFRISVCSPA
jgi:branched-chain amino acid transport system ATP-binding protein